MHTVWSYLVFASSYGHVPGAVNGLNTGGRCMVCVCEGVRGDRCRGWWAGRGVSDVPSLGGHSLTSSLHTTTVCICTLFPCLILTLSYCCASDVMSLVVRLVLVAVCKELDVLSLLNFVNW